MTAKPEFSRPLLLDRLAAGTTQQDIAATPEECTAIAHRLAIPAVLALACRFRLRRGEAGRIEAEAELRARVVRECVVTLDEFEADADEEFRIAFVPHGTEADEDPESDDEIPYQDGVIDLGEAAVEQLALSLDPYPRKPGAALPDEAEETPESPFAMLGRRRPGN